MLGARTPFRLTEDRVFIALVLLVLGAGPGWAVTYTTNPPAVTQGIQGFVLEISRGLTPEGYSDDEIDSFNWYGPSNPFPNSVPIKLPKAQLVSLGLVRIMIG